MDKPIVHALPSAGLAERSERVHMQWLAGVHYNPAEETEEYIPVVSMAPTQSLPQTVLDAPDDENVGGMVDVVAQ